jgi:hypothetical protein
MESSTSSRRAIYAWIIAFIVLLVSSVSFPGAM